MLWLLLACAGAPAPTVRPDLVLVTWDTVRADHVGPGSGTHTPVLDQLLADGVRFDNARAPSAMTLPAHATMLSGLYPHGHGARENIHFQVDAGVPHLAEQLSAAGYATGGFVSSLVLAPHAGLSRGFAHYDADIVPTGPDAPVDWRPGTDTVEAAARWLATVPDDQPVFLMVHLFEPHRPWDPPAELAALHPNDPYRGEIAAADQATGGLLGALAAEGRTDRAVVVLTSDHGESLGAHGELTHGYFAYDATLRVPLVIRAGPQAGVLTKGSRSLPVSLADLAPTLAELAGLETWAADGRSLVPELAAPTMAPTAQAFESVLPAVLLGTAPIFGVLTPDRQVWIDGPQPELYDLGTDPGQQHNAYTPALAQESARWHARFDRAWPPPSLDRPDPSVASQLEALGYLSGVASSTDLSVDAKERIAWMRLHSDADERPLEDVAADAAALTAQVGPQPFITDIHARLLRGLGRYREAEAVLARGLAADPTDEASQQALAALRKQRREKTALVPAIQQALVAAPDNPDARYDLALTLHWLEELPAAEAAYAEAVRRAPQDDALRAQYARLLGRMDRVDQALELLAEGQARDPHAPILDCIAGRLHARYTGDQNQAVRHLRTCQQAGGALTAPDHRLLREAPD